MRRLFLVIMLALLSNPIAAEEHSRIGKARIFNNDYFGDNKDRWRTGSYSVSYIKGPKWQGKLPGGIGEVLEFRLRTEIIAPDDLSNPVIGTDRPYVGALSFGVLTHFERGGNDLMVGLDFVTVGPQTGVGDFQTAAHRLVGATLPQVLGSQVANGFFPTITAELGRELTLVSDGEMPVRLRPFIEAQAGVETFVRIGADLTIGRLGMGDLRVRDTVTGQRIAAVRSQGGRGVSLVFGADAAYVIASEYLPAARGYALTDARLRVRGGVLYERKASSIFYGLTWLGKEFAAQDAEQVVGSLSFRLKFDK